MPRFFMAGANIGEGLAVIAGEDANHVRALRLQAGDEIVICDGEGVDYMGLIRDIEPGKVHVRIVKSVQTAAEPDVKVMVLAGLPKGARADFLVQKCVECGASEIVFFLSRRCVARPDEKSMDKKLLRWQKIAEEAAKQSERGIIPTVTAVPDIVEALDLAIHTDLPLFFYETGERIPLKQALQNRPRPKTAAIITGPEGGFEAFEADMARALQIPVCSMGPRIFRCETAPVAALSALMYATDNLN